MMPFQLNLERPRLMCMLVLVEVTAPNLSSSEIGQAKCPHCTIANGVCTELFSAELKPSAGRMHCVILCSSAFAAYVKPHKENCDGTDTTEATECWQDTQIHFGFFAQHSIRTTRVQETMVETMQGVMHIVIGAITSQSQSADLCSAEEVIDTDDTREC